MQYREKTPALALAVVAGLALSASPALGQERGDITFDASGGVAVPVGDLGDMVQAGPAFDLGIGYRVTPGLAVRMSGGADLFQGIDATAAGTEGPDVTIVHMNAGLLYDVLSGRDSPMSLAVRGEVGGSVLNSPRQPIGTGSNVAIIDLSEFTPEVGAGLDVGYAVSDRVSLFASGGAHATFADEEDLFGFTVLQPELEEPPSTLISVPLTAGVQFRFPR